MGLLLETMGFYQSIKSKIARYRGKGLKESESKDSIHPLKSTACSGRVIHLAKLPSRYLVDLDLTTARDENSNSSPTIAADACELVHLVVQTIELECQWVPKRHRYTLKTFCTVSIGKQTYVGPDIKAVPRNENGDKFSMECNYGATFVMNQGGASKVRVAVYCRGRLDGALKNRFIGYGIIDLGPMILL